MYTHTCKIRYSKIKLIYHLKEVLLFEQNSKIISNKMSVKKNKTFLCTYTNLGKKIFHIGCIL